MSESPKEVLDAIRNLLSKFRDYAADATGGEWPAYLDGNRLFTMTTPEGSEPSAIKVQVNLNDAVALLRLRDLAGMVDDLLFERITAAFTPPTPIALMRAAAAKEQQAKTAEDHAALQAHPDIVARRSAPDAASRPPVVDPDA